ncbi:MAK10-like protein [Tanacetum coccineum]
MSSTGSMLIANGDDCLDGYVGAGGGEVNGREVVLGVFKSSLRENPGGAIGVIRGELSGVDGGAVWLADRTKSFPIGFFKNVEVHIGKLKLLEDFYVIDLKKYPATPFLVGRGFLATANAVIDCKKDNIAVGEGITRSIFGVKEIDLGDEDVPYWITFGIESL